MSEELSLEEDELVDFLKWLGNYEYSFEPGDYVEVVKDYTEYKKKRYERLNRSTISG
jgi:hypothetical protein